jgi:hypothetical protein
VLAGCSAHGLRCGVWRTRGFTAADAAYDVSTLHPQLFIAEGEIPAQILRDDGPHPNPQAQDWVALADALDHWPIDCAVATSFGPFQSYVQEGDRWVVRPDPEIARPLIEAGWFCLPYVYPAEHHGITARRMLDYAAHYGPEWAAAEPVCGVYGGYTIDDPAFAAKDGAPGYSLWDAGEVLP